MDIREIAPGFSVAGQIEPSDVQTLAQLGYKTIVCNRPDGEAAGQPDHASIEAAAKNAGLAFAYNPVSSAGLTPTNVDHMEQTLGTAAKPILAYCRSGARSTNLFAIASA